MDIVTHFLSFEIPMWIIIVAGVAFLVLLYEIFLGGMT